MEVPVLPGSGSSHEAKGLAQSARLILGGLLSRPAVTLGAAGCNALQTIALPLSQGLLLPGLGNHCVWERAAPIVVATSSLREDR